MAERQFYVELLYQGTEEVLGLNVVYFEDDGEPDLPQIAARQLADELATNIGNFADVFGAENTVYGIIVTTPNIGGSGPARVEHHRNVPVGLGETNAPDVVTVNLKYAGQNNAGQAVTGGLRISGVSSNQIDCNALLGSYGDDIATAMANVFPPVIVLSGRNFRLSIESVRGGTTEYVGVDTIGVNPLVGTRIDRVGNRPQRRKQAATNGGGGDPT